MVRASRRGIYTVYTQCDRIRVTSPLSNCVEFRVGLVARTYMDFNYFEIRIRTNLRIARVLNKLRFRIEMRRK